MKIVIVGGVAAGMSAAARARRLDESAEIVVLERGEHVSFAGCGLPYHVGGEIGSADALLVQTPASLQAALRLDVRTRHNVVGLDADARTVRVRTPDGEQAIGYDALVLAPGAQAVLGFDSPRVRTLRTVPDAVTIRGWVDAGARRAVVLGAGFIGLEAAEQLAAAGVAVDLVERADHVLPPLEPELAILVREELTRLGVTVHESTSATAVTPAESGADRDVVVLSDGARLEADLVVLSVGVRPDTAVFAAAGVATERGAIVVDEHGHTNLPHVWAAGDAIVSTDAVTGARRPVPLAGPANRAGRLVADAILRPETARPIPAAVGTAVVRVGRLAAGLTGANRESLVRAGISHHTLHLHPTQHAGWFPGATQVHLVVHVGQDGRLLGGQAVGADGVDKRLDVLATAIRAGLGAEDLIDLDLAYAPPFGAAKDPINLAGMVAGNVLDGTLRLWHAADLDEVMASALVLDVRSRQEFATGSIPGSLNIPHTELRERLEEVREAAAGRPVRVTCQSGVRAHIAHRVLTHAGFDSASLSGGMLTLRAALGSPAADRLTRADAPAKEPVR
ncbi:FAD-dependent oxidoreductase [Xylanimonas ulmi]|uniref:NADPH-dependent 2,4-dienoyl-CoA reductase/sulfur reductase-like enzyme n=1 Tax=Xylanimonas ulmi TaxID=228973 RepID=A0A4V2EYE9_9MICO|nr:FAD-dependent oxidoreductase [Xylanibacterium ulmi]RZS62750.1 NADPH-dependent 2,4-dienoyl-CoA reductase/sulfur reductase-like enzyme [Xylanibacterium ulmi]